LTCSLIPISFSDNSSVTEHGFFGVEQDTYILEYGDEFQLVKISGIGDVSQGSDRAKAVIIITNPDSTQNSHRTISGSDGYFELTFPLYYHSQIGIYKVFATFDKHVLGEVFFTVERLSITESGTNSNSSTEEEHVFEFRTSMFEVATDSLSYEKDEIIHIVGVVPTQPILDLTLQIIDPMNNRILINQITPNSDGTFEDSINTNGPLWKFEGDYTIRIHHNEQDLYSTFSFSIPTNEVVPNPIEPSIDTNPVPSSGIDFPPVVTPPPPPEVTPPLPEVQQEPVQPAQVQEESDPTGGIVVLVVIFIIILIIAKKKSGKKKGQYSKTKTYTSTSKPTLPKTVKTSPIQSHTGVSPTSIPTKIDDIKVAIEKIDENEEEIPQKYMARDFLKGDYFYSIKNYEKALFYYNKELEGAIAYDVISKKAHTLFHLDRFPEAIECYDKNLKKYFDRPEFWRDDVGKGDALAAMGDIQEAKKCYNDAKEKAPGYGRVMIKKKLKIITENTSRLEITGKGTRIELADVTNTLDLIDKNKQPTRPHIIIDSLKKFSNLDSALQFCDELISSLEDDPESTIRIIDGRLVDTSITILSSMINQKIEILKIVNDYPKIIIEYDKLMKIEPPRHKHYLLKCKADALIGMDTPESCLEAIKCCDEALKLKSKSYTLETKRRAEALLKELSRKSSPKKPVNIKIESYKEQIKKFEPKNKTKTEDEKEFDRLLQELDETKSKSSNNNDIIIIDKSLDEEIDDLKQKDTIQEENELKETNEDSSIDKITADDLKKSLKKFKS